MKLPSPAATKAHPREFGNDFVVASFVWGAVIVAFVMVANVFAAGS